MGVLPTMRSDKSEILPYNFKDYYAFIGLEKLSDHPSFRMFNHWHDEVEIIVPIRGHMVYSINGELVHLDESNGVFINSNQIHYGFPPTTPIANLFLHCGIRLSCVPQTV